MDKTQPNTTNKTIEELVEEVNALTKNDEQEMKEGQQLYEMEKSSPGWQVVKRWLEDMAFHTWVDPREIDAQGGLSKAEWEWRELNAFHAANVAKEILENIAKASSRAEYLHKVKTGVIKRKSLKL